MFICPLLVNKGEAIKQAVVETTDRHKHASLFATNPFMSIIFCRTKRRADILELAMKQEGYNCKKLHSDIPETVESYIHRIVHTGRACEEGYTRLFIDPKNSRLLEEIETAIGFTLPRRKIMLG